MHLEVVISQVVEAFLPCRITELDIERLSIDLDFHHIGFVVVAYRRDLSTGVLLLLFDEAAQERSFPHLMVANHTDPDRLVAHALLSAY